jgi:hypothetical protein
MAGPRLSAERCRALELLASGRHGASEALLGLGYGFCRRLLAVRAAAGWRRRRAMASGKVVEVVRIRITAAGRRASRGERFLLACAMLQQGHDKSGHIG